MVEKKRPTILLDGSSARRSSGGWPPSGAGGTERRPVPLSAQLRCIMSKGVARVSGGGAAYDRAHEDTDL